jgi:hypothetical protein
MHHLIHKISGDTKTRATRSFAYSYKNLKKKKIKKTFF